MVESTTGIPRSWSARECTLDREATSRRESGCAGELDAKAERNATAAKATCWFLRVCIVELGDELKVQRVKQTLRRRESERQEPSIHSSPWLGCKLGNGP